MPNGAHTRLQGTREQPQLRTNTVRTGHACHLARRQGTDNSKRGQRPRQKNFCISHKQHVRHNRGSDGHEKAASFTCEGAAYVRSACFALRLPCHVPEAHPLYTAAQRKRVLEPCAAQRVALPRGPAAASDKLGASHAFRSLKSDKTVTTTRRRSRHLTRTL